MKSYEIKSFFGCQSRAIEKNNELVINPDKIIYMYYVGEFPLGKPNDEYKYNYNAASMELKRAGDKSIKIYKVVLNTNCNDELSLLIDEDDFKILSITLKRGR